MSFACLYNADNPNKNTAGSKEVGQYVEEI
jgi:hypothetical protein